MRTVRAVISILYDTGYTKYTMKCTININTRVMTSGLYTRHVYVRMIITPM